MKSVPKIENSMCWKLIALLWNMGVFPGKYFFFAGKWICICHYQCGKTKECWLYFCNIYKSKSWHARQEAWGKHCYKVNDRFLSSGITNVFMLHNSPICISSIVYLRGLWPWRPMPIGVKRTRNSSMNTEYLCRM